MPEPITKHAFVDDNPYIAYTGEPETAVSGGSGGGGVGIVPVITNISVGVYSCNIDYETLKTAILNGSVRFAVCGVDYIESEGTIGYGSDNPQFCKAIVYWTNEIDQEYIIFDFGNDSGVQYHPDGTFQYFD